MPNKLENIISYIDGLRTPKRRIDFKKEFFEREKALPPVSMYTFTAWVVALFAPEGEWETVSDPLRKSIRLIKYAIQYHNTNQSLLVFYLAPDHDHFASAKREFAQQGFTGGEYVLHLLPSEADGSGTDDVASAVRVLNAALMIVGDVEWKLEKVSSEEWKRAASEVFTHEKFLDPVWSLEEIFCELVEAEQNDKSRAPVNELEDDIVNRFVQKASSITGVRGETSHEEAGKN
ncbi:MAG TPA: hypothetical protein GXX19_10870 [Syntrophomonadaceae bacterium]|nr:hypothetical protein [Syntrophomonadaceae bacterium]